MSERRIGDYFAKLPKTSTSSSIRSKGKSSAKQRQNYSLASTSTSPDTVRLCSSTSSDPARVCASTSSDPARVYASTSSNPAPRLLPTMPVLAHQLRLSLPVLEHCHRLGLGVSHTKITSAPQRNRRKSDYEAVVRRRRFLASWTEEFLWLYRDERTDKMFCSWCSCHGTPHPFADKNSRL